MAPTLLNDSSSRSHMVIKITVDRQPLDAASGNLGTSAAIVIVDLAGSREHRGRCRRQSPAKGRRYDKARPQRHRPHVQGGPEGVRRCSNASNYKQGPQQTARAAAKGAPTHLPTDGRPIIGMILKVSVTRRAVVLSCVVFASALLAEQLLA